MAEYGHKIYVFFQKDKKIKQRIKIFFIPLRKICNDEDACHTYSPSRHNIMAPNLENGSQISDLYAVQNGIENNFKLNKNN
jgi:hypothetical protein